MGRNRLPGPGVHGRPALAIAIIFFLAIGCTREVSVKRFVGWEEPYEDGNYPQAIEKFTREARIYRGLELELLANATYKSSDFRRAYLQEYSRVYKLDEAQVQAVRQKETEAAQKVDEFMIATYVPDKQWDDFDRKNPSWKIYLVQRDGSRIQPVSIQKNKVDASMRHFFPYINPWKSMYTVQFPKLSAGKESPSMRLIVTGVRGNIEMEWPSESPGNESTKPD